MVICLLAFFLVWTIWTICFCSTSTNSGILSYFLDQQSRSSLRFSFFKLEQTWCSWRHVATPVPEKQKNDLWDSGLHILTHIIHIIGLWMRKTSKNKWNMDNLCHFVPSYQISDEGSEFKRSYFSICFHLLTQKSASDLWLLNPHSLPKEGSCSVKLHLI